MAGNNIPFGKDAYANPGYGGFAVAPNDSTDLTTVTRALYVGTAGDLTVTMLDGNDVLIKGAATGYHPLMVTRVKTTGTTASNIVALY